MVTTLSSDTHSSLRHAPCEPLVCRCAVVVSRSLPPQSPVLLTPPISKNSAAPPRLTPLALGDACPPPPPDQNDLEPPMLPPYGHDANPRSCCSPLRMISAFLNAAKSSALVALMLVERFHGVFCRSGGALGHGTGLWDDVTGVDIDMNARRQAVDEWMVRRETQSMYWEQPLNAYRRSSSYRSQQQTIHDA